MSLWDSPLIQQFSRDAEHLEHVVVPNDHVFPSPADTGPVMAGESYFRIWVVQMFLGRDREWFKTWYPVVQALTTFRFGDLPNPVDLAQVAGPRHLHDLDPTHLDRVVQLDYQLTPLVPFSGGTVQIEAGLVAMQADDLIQRFLGVMGSFAGLLAVPQLSSALSIATAVSNGLQQLLGVEDKQLVLGYQQTFAGSGAGPNELGPTFIALVNTTSGTHTRERLWVKDSALLYGDDVNSAQELKGVDYMLLRIEVRRERDDWDALTSISEPWTKAINALSQLDASGNPRLADADVFVRNAAVAALGSHDLTSLDRTRVARAIRDRYEQYKAAIGLDGSAPRGAATARATAPAPPALADVARGARSMDSSPLTVGELFAN